MPIVMNMRWSGVTKQQYDSIGKGIIARKTF